MVSPLVWVLDLSLSALTDNAGASEQWSVWGFLQLAGLGLTLGGTLSYNAVGPFSQPTWGVIEAREVSLVEPTVTHDKIFVYDLKVCF